MPTPAQRDAAPTQQEYDRRCRELMRETLLRQQAEAAHAASQSQLDELHEAIKPHLSLGCEPESAVEHFRSLRLELRHAESRERSLQVELKQSIDAALAAEQASRRDMEHAHELKQVIGTALSQLEAQLRSRTFELHFTIFGAILATVLIGGLAFEVVVGCTLVSLAAVAFVWIRRSIPSRHLLDLLLVLDRAGLCAHPTSSGIVSREWRVVNKPEFGQAITPLLHRHHPKSPRRLRAGELVAAIERCYR